MANQVYHMFGIGKRKILVWSVIFSGLLVSCSDSEVLTGHELSGNTQGTTYSIIVAESNINFSQNQIDSILSAFDQSLSTYEESSVISTLNEGNESISVNDPSGFFKQCYGLSRSVYNETSGLFDPSVFPLVKGWGFMNNIESPLSKSKVDSILAFVSFKEGEHHTITFADQEIHLSKKDDRFKLDFNAIAQGLSVDVLDAFIASVGHTNYYIEIGGEVMARGVNREGVPWKIGIDTPKENQTTRELVEIIHLSDRAVATSGNYRKFYVHNGTKYAHTLHPKTGFPVQHSLLSATVVADNCALADAYATAFMVMGADETIDFLASHPTLGLEVFLLSSDSEGAIIQQMSEGFKKYLEE